MKTKKVIADSICLLLALELFYEGVSKLFNLHAYAAWLKFVPYLQTMPGVLSYVIPAAEIALACLLAFSKRKPRALLICTGALVLYVAWVLSAHLLTRTIFWPYDALWPNPNWIQKMFVAVGMAWLAIAGAMLDPTKKEVIHSVP